MARAVHTLTDDLDFYVETRDIVGSILTIAGTATQTVNSATLQQTGQGAIFYINPNPVVATCTVRYNLIGNDPVSGKVFTIASLSLDGLAITATGNALSVLYVTPQPATGINSGTALVVPLPRNFRVQASITVATATATNAYNGTVGMTRLGVI